MAGNTCVLKHASNVMSCAEKIEDILVNAGLPENTFRNLKMSSKQAQQVIEHPSICGVASQEVRASAVAAMAGAALKSAF